MASETPVGTLAGTQRKVIMAIDASEYAETAFKWYLKNVAQPNDKVYVITVREIHNDIGLPVIPGNISQENLAAIIKRNKEENEKIEDLLGRYTEELRRQKISHVGELISDRLPGHGICEAANHMEANLIVLGTRGLGKFRRTILGSCSEYVVHHANCPVIIVPKQN